MPLQRKFADEKRLVVWLLRGRCIEPLTAWRGSACSRAGLKTLTWRPRRIGRGGVSTRLRQWANKPMLQRVLRSQHGAARFAEARHRRELAFSPFDSRNRRTARSLVGPNLQIGLSAVSRERRAGQIQADLWDHYSDRTEDGASPAVIGLEALGRATSGAAADLVWRLEQKRREKDPAEAVGSKLERKTKLPTTTVQKVMLGLVVLLAVYQLVVLVAGTAAGVGITSADEAPGRDSAAALTLAVISGAGFALIVTGLRQRAQAPGRAGILLAIGVAPSILIFWMIIPPIIALVVAVYFLIDGSTRQRKLRAGT